MSAVGNNVPYMLACLRYVDDFLIENYLHFSSAFEAKLVLHCLRGELSLT